MEEQVSDRSLQLETLNFHLSHLTAQQIKRIVNKINQRFTIWPRFFVTTELPHYAILLYNIPSALVGTNFFIHSGEIVKSKGVELYLYDANTNREKLLGHVNHYMFHILTSGRSVFLLTEPEPREDQGKVEYYFSLYSLT